MEDKDLEDYFSTLQTHFLKGEYQEMESFFVLPLVVYTAAGVVVVQVHEDLVRLAQQYRAAMVALVVLSGTVSSSAAAKNAMTIAERYAPGTVANLMSVRGSQQVMLAVRFVEMRRDAVKRLGINSLSSISAGAAPPLLVRKRPLWL